MVYFNEEGTNSYSRFLDNMKASGNVRLLSLNPHRCRPNNTAKMNMIKNDIMSLQIDLMLLHETNAKWVTVNISKTERRVKNTDREAVIFAANSNEWETTSSDYLPG